jgi:preprotein translocase subunit SecG
MSVVVTVLHVIVCVFLIAVVLLQRGKGAQVGAVFGGGGGSTMFGGRGAGNFLTKLTAGAAAVFMLTSLSLAYMRMNRGERLFEDGAIEEESTAPKPLPFEEVGKVPGEAPAEPGAAPPAEAPAPAPAP